MKFSLKFFIYLFANLLICLFLNSCDKNVVMERHQNIVGEKWDYADEKTFSAEIIDTVQHYAIYINVRHGFNFEWRNMWVKIETTFPNGKVFERRVNLQFSQGNGEWFGDILGDNCDIQISIQEHAVFPQQGKYTFKLSQDMRVNPLGYMKTIGMRIEKEKGTPQ